MSTITTGAGELGRLGEQAEQAVRALAHLTRPALGAPSDPPEAAALIAALARATGGLPQLTAQLASWLIGEQQAGRLRLDGCSPCPDPAAAVTDAVTQVTAALAQAASCAHAASHALDAAQQAVAYLVSEPEGRA